MAKIISSGKYPTIYQFEENGEHFMLGSDVGAYLGHFKGNLYKRYPSLERRIINSMEREALAIINIDNRTLCNMGTMVVKASEAMQIIKGEGEYLRKKDTAAAKRNDKAKESINVAFCRKRSNRSDLQDLRENLSFMPSARGKKAPKRIIPKAIDRSRSLSSVPEYPDMACTVVNNMILSNDTNPNRSPPAKKTRKISKEDKKDDNPLLDSIDIESCSEELLNEIANALEELIPIRLNLDIDGIKLRDNFTWNNNETYVSLKQFALMLCNDLDLDEDKFVQPIVDQMERQIEEYKASRNKSLAENNKSDSRAIIKLNVHIGNLSLQDQFEWDIVEALNSPEEFAKYLCTELGLGGEFLPAISYSIRVQLNWLKTTINEKNFKERPTIKEPAIRPQEELDDWCPYLDTLSDEEIVKIMKDEERNVRRLRRLANLT